VGRNNKQGQSKRSKIGTAFQQAVYGEIETFLERTGQDSKFEIVNLGRKETRLSSGLLISPDLIIRKIETQVVCVRFGCKTSLRERWKQDDRDARLVGDSAWWIEITKREGPTSSCADIRKKCAEIQQQSAFKFVVSLQDPDSLNEMFKHLERQLVELSV
jgi:hypothetical protein